MLETIFAWIFAHQMFVTIYMIGFIFTWFWILLEGRGFWRGIFYGMIFPLIWVLTIFYNVFAPPSGSIR